MPPENDLQVNNFLVFGHFVSFFLIPRNTLKELIGTGNIRKQIILMH
jgi:hypothetical protein